MVDSDEIRSLRPQKPLTFYGIKSLKTFCWVLPERGKMVVMQKGDKVRLTTEGKARGFGTVSDSVKSRNGLADCETGTVVRFDGDSVKVLIDGWKTPQAYHVSFWELDQAAIVPADPATQEA